MLAAGDLGLISDPNLRDELTVYFNEHDVAQVLDSLPEYRETVRGIIPIEMQDYIWDNCYASECGTPEAADLTSSIAVQLMMDQNLNSQLRYWVSTQRAALFIYEGRKELTQATLDALRPLREPM